MLVILASLLLFYFLGASLSEAVANHSHRYVRGAMSWLEGLFSGYELWAVATLLIIPVAGVALLLFMVGWIFGVLGVFVLHVLFFSCCFSGALIRLRFRTTQSPYATYVGVFGITFWYFFAGPLAMVFYYLVHQSLTICTQETHSASARFAYLAHILDYIPVRLLTLTLALVGNFQSGIARCFQDLKDFSRSAEAIMSAWAQGVGAQAGDEKSAPDNEAIAVRFERVGWLWLALLLMISLSLLLG